MKKKYEYRKYLYRTDLEVDNLSILRRMINLCWICLLVCVGLGALGSDYFNIVVTNERFIAICEFVDNSFVLTTMLQYGSFMLLYGLYLPTVIEDIDIRRTMILYTLVFPFKSYAYGLSGIAVDVMVTMILPILLNGGGAINSLMRYAVLNVFVSVSAIAKNIFGWGIPQSTTVASAFMIDIFLMMALQLLYFKKGGSKQWELGDLLGFYRNASTACANFAKTSLRKLPELTRKLLAFPKKWTNLPTWRKSEIRFTVTWYSVILGCFFGFAFLFGKEMSALLFLGCYLNLRYMFPKTFHDKDFYGCVRSSIFMLLSSAHIMLPTNISIFSVVVIAYATGLLLCLFQDYLDLVARYLLDFTRYGLTPRSAKIAYDWKVEGLDGAELMQKYGMSQDALDKAKTRISNKLGDKPKRENPNGKELHNVR